MIILDTNIVAALMANGADLRREISATSMIVVSKS
jgi:hypothetical protein